MMTRNLLLAGLIGATALTPAAASGQAWLGAWIGSRVTARRVPNPCYHQKRYFSPTKIAAVRLAADNSIGQYWSSTHVASPAGDPSSIRAASVETAPRMFVRSNDGKAAYGIWALLTTDGKVAGWYRATWAEAKGVWRLQTMDVLPPTERPRYFAFYCHVPGDSSNGLLSFDPQQDVANLNKGAEQAEQPADEAMTPPATKGATKTR
jgi:hypothetical protein